MTSSEPTADVTTSPPFTIASDHPQQPFQLPNYDEAMANSGPVNMGWTQPIMSSPPPYTEQPTSKKKPRAPVGLPEYTVYQDGGAATSASVVYVTQNPRSLMDNTTLPGGLMRCPSCRDLVHTRVVYTPGCQTHMWACIMFSFGFWPCCVLPYCCPACQDASHFCDNCGAYVGST